MKFTRALAFVVAILAAGQAYADVVSITTVKDNTLYEDPTGQLSNGIGPVMFVGETNTGGVRRGLIEFDIAGSVPAGATINSVSLRMYCSRTTASAKRVELHAAVQEWGEGASAVGSDTGGGGGAGAGAQPGDATWLHTFYSDSFWANPGGDFAAASSADTIVGSVGTYTWTSATMRSDVQSWLASPGSNHGWLMLGIEGSTRSTKRFNTREASNATTFPTLTINYTPVPEPATLALLALGLVVAARRR